MAINLSSLTPVTTTATALSNLVLVSPQTTVGYQPNPPNAASTNFLQIKFPPPLLFHYEGEQAIKLKSDITDHYIEDNTAIQDQIALRPVTYRTHGFIGELNDVAPYGLQTLKTIAQKLTLVEAYTPALTVAALVAYNTALQLYQVGANALNSAVSTWATVNGNGQTTENVIGSNGLEGGAVNLATGAVNNNQNKQQIAFQQFFGYWNARTFFTIQTPWAVFKNMVIEDLTALQTDETNVITDFEVMFKQIRTAKSAIAPNPTIGDGRSGDASAPATDLGTNTPPASITQTSALSTMGAPVTSA